ncbi:hypothetical protein [Rossellomorea sp. NRS-1567]
MERASRSTEETLFQRKGFFALFDSERPVDEVIQELGEDVVPYFPGIEL